MSGTEIKEHGNIDETDKAGYPAERRGKYAEERTE